LAFELELAKLSMEAFRRFENGLITRGKRIDKPKPGVMTSAFVSGAWVSKPHNQLNG
jgi:hypothetical protein